MNAHTILLVEDNLTDEKLALRALSKCKVPNQVVVARDGAEAIDYLLGRGSHAEPNMSALPSLVLLDLKLPNFVLTPHVAWASQEAMQILADQLIDNIEAFVGGSPQNVVE